MIKEIYNEIKKYDLIIIHRHQKPDGDALGSQFGLKEILKTKFPEKIILVVGDSSEIENSSLKNIFTEEFDDVNDEDYKNQSLSIILDTANLERIKSDKSYLSNSIIKIDHHVTEEKYGTMEWIESDSSSTCEMISKFARNLKLEVNSLAAKYLMTGIFTDTGRFSYSSTTHKTFEEALFLSSTDIKISEISNLLNDRDLNFVRLQGKVLSDFLYNSENKIAYYMMPKNLHKKFDVKYEVASSMIYLLMSFREVDYALYATYNEEEKIWKASLRSRKEPINKIAEEHRGGGHKMAAGLKLTDRNEFREVLNKLRLINSKNKEIEIEINEQEETNEEPKSTD